MKENPEATFREVDAIIRNTYRTLMTRGQKDCYVYCTDQELANYLKSRLNRVYAQREEVAKLLVADEQLGY